MNEKQLVGLADYMNSNSINFKTLLTYDGMDGIASGVLCRWLRPSELSNLSRIMNQGDLIIQRATLKLQLPNDKKPGDFVGELGENLINLTITHNLLYAWYHNSNKTLVLYSLKKGDLNAAMKNSMIADFKVDAIIQEKIGNANWGNVGQITNIRTYANVVRGKPATVRSTANKKPATTITPKHRKVLKTFDDVKRYNKIGMSWANHVEKESMQMRRASKKS
jgi:hypothetical protein